MVIGPPAVAKKSLLFQHGKAPAHKAKYTINWLKGYSFGEDKLMILPANSPDLNLIENLWAIIKRRAYQDGRQFSSCVDLRNAIEDAAASITPVYITKLTSSVDLRVMKIL